MSKTNENEVNYIELPLLKPNTVEDRLYQRIIAYKATLKNTLVVLPTALGKTIISALVALHLFRKYKDKRILIMAPTRPLVIQHRETYKKILKINPSNLVVLTGKIPAYQREKIWNGSSRIIFATPQVVKNDLENNILSLKDFCLLVFDECHRARKDYAYTSIAKYYFEQCDWPLILGITASPGSSLEKIQEICDALYIEQIEYRCEEDEDVAPYINPVKVYWQKVNLPEEYKRVSEIVKLMLKEKIEKLNSYGLISKDFKHITRKDLLDLGEELRKRLNEAYEKGPIYNMIALQSASLTLFHLLELIETQGIKQAKQFLEKIDLNERMSYEIIKNDPYYFSLKDMLEKYIQIEHTKVIELKKIIEEQIKNHPESRIIVFTQYRSTASLLVETLKEIEGVFVERFVGQASKSYDDHGLTQEEQISILEEFRSGKLNVLVATSIAEEGLDIPTVDLVVFYEPIPSEIRYIQRKGRTGRKKVGKAIILVTSNTSDIAYFYASRKKAEKMRRIVKALNQKLKPAQRKGNMPIPNPLTQEEIKEIEELAELEELGFKGKIEKELKLEEELLKLKPKPIVEVKKGIKLDEFKVKEKLSISEESIIEQTVYIKALEAGFYGKTMDELIKECVDMGFEHSLVINAINKLLKEEKLSKTEFNKIFVKPLEESENIHSIEVLKILPGMAKVLIDNKHEAIIFPEDFNGPLNILKKHAVFKAKGEFYKIGDSLNFRVSELLEVY